MQTQREDRTGVPRDELPQGALVNFRGEANAQHLIDTWRKRLCYQASPETRQYAEDFKQTLSWVEPEISDVLVPNCVYRCGCPEMQMCRERTWAKFCAWSEEHGVKVQMLNIRARYDLYNMWFREQKKDEQ